MSAQLFDSAIVDNPASAVDFVTNILQASTEYSIIGKSLDGTIVLWNEGARRLYGYEPEEVVGKMNSSVLHTPEDVEAGKPAEILHEALATGKWEGRIERLRRDGMRFTARVVITPRYDTAGKPIGFLLISKDISGEVRLSQELKATQLYTVVGDATSAVDFITNILQASTEYSIIGKSLDGSILLWNEGARRLYGYDAEEVVGRANSSILHTPEDVRAGRPGEILKAAIQDGKWEGTIERMRKNGSRFTARVVITPRRDANGRPVGFLLISKDISDEIRLTEELKATQLYTRSLIESNIDALMTTDPLGIITDINQQMETLTGLSRDELIGTPFKNYFTDPTMAEQGIRRVLSEGRVTNYELTARAKDGRETVVSYNAATLYDRDGRLQGVFAAARDVTERKRFEQTLQEQNIELERASQAKDRFLANMSHELRTPLNAIIGFTDTMLLELPGPLNDEQTLQLETIQGSSRHLLSLINDLLDVAKIESGKIQLNIEPVVVQDLLAESLAPLLPMAEQKGIAIGTRLPEAPVLLRTDRRALSQIIINLVNNAIKFTVNGGITVTLETEQLNGHIRTRIRVKDSGVGIHPDQQSRLFQAFEQLEGTERAEGTGLGLYLSQKLAGLLGGHIECTSNFGVGSEFCISLHETLPVVPIAAMNDRIEIATPTEVSHGTRAGG